MTCCVTGHRPQGFPFSRDENNERYIQYRETLLKSIENLISIGYDTFITGMAEGADLDFAVCVLHHKKQYPHIILEAARPYPARPAKHIRESTEKRASILALCDCIHEVAPCYHAGCMQKRNIFMVDKSDLVLAIWNGTEKGGTWNTIRYARQKNKNIQYIRISP